MSNRARDFLNDWFGKHIEALPAIERMAVSVRLAGKCRQDAITAGIPLQEIRDAVGGDLIKKVLQLLDVAAVLQEAVALQEKVPLVSNTSASVQG
jgi:hypothetical protein